MNCHFDLSEITDLRAVESQWLALQEKAECSWFQSWGWIGNWLEQIAVDFHPQLLTARDGEHLLALGVLVPRNIRRHAFVRSHAWFLNEYPFDGWDMVIEYNGLLVEQGKEVQVYSGLQEFFSRLDGVDELFIGAVSNTALVLPGGFNCLDHSTSRSVTLNQRAASRTTFLQSLSKNRRAQLRRSFRLAENPGPLFVEQAGTLGEARDFFDQLKLLHTERWRQVSGAGAFANPNWEAFHRALIESRFENGDIQLLRIRNNESVQGYLYNFIWRDRVYVLTTGFAVTPNKHLMPGYMCHVEAIVFNRQRGMKIYDLMHGDSVYKRVLCDREEILSWYVLHKQHRRFKVENMARSLVRSWRSFQS